MKNKLRNLLAVALFAAAIPLAAQPLNANAGAGTSVCAGSGAVIGGAPSATYGSAPYTYSWLPATGLSGSTAANPTATPGSTTTYTLTVTDAVFSTATSTVTVTVNPQPVASSTPAAQTICSGNNCGLSLNSTVAGSTFSWTVSQSGVTGASPGGGSAISQSLTATGVTAGTATYTVTATSPAGCVSAPATIVVTVNPNPSITSTGSVTICSGTSVGLSFTSNIASTYTWSAVDNTSTTGESTTSQTGATLNNILNSTAPSTTNVSYTVQATSLAGCPGSFYPVTVTVNSIPLITPSPSSTTICSGSTAAFTWTSSIAGTSYSYAYSPSGVIGGTSGAGSVISQVLNTTGGAAGTATYTMTGTAAGCASTPVNVVATVNPLPVVSVSGSSICSGGSATLSASVSPFGGTYIWNPGGIASANPIVSPATTTTYTCMYTYAGCTNSGSGTITVNALPTVNAGPDQTICSGTALTFGSGATGATSYNWVFGDGGTSTLLSPTYTYTTPGSYTATLTAVSSGGCTMNDAAVITVNSTPSVSTTVNNVTCFGACNGSLTATATGGTPGYTYLWSPAGGVIPTASALCAGVYIITVTDVNGCVGTQTSTVTEPAAFTVAATLPQSICAGSSAVLTATTSGGVSPFSFNWNDGGTNYPTQTVTVTPAAGTSYTLTATDNSGCIVNDYTSVSVGAATDFYGHVSYSGGSLSSGTNTAVLYGFVAATNTFDTAMTSPIDAGGNFHFTAVPTNNYIIKAFNDTLVYPLLIPTYYGGAYVWDSAMVQVHDCTVNDTTDIAMIEVPLMTGGGHVDGSISEGAGFSRMPGDPIPGVDIKLGRNPGGQLVASTQSQPVTGQYSFDNIPDNLAGESYVIYVDIPGLDRIATYNFVIDPAHQNFITLDFEADSTTVYPTQMSVGVNTISAKESKLSVYPNPSNDRITLEYGVNENSSVSIEVYNLLGVKVAMPYHGKQTAGTYKYTFSASALALSPGVYFISLSADGKTTTQRVIITE